MNQNNPNFPGGEPGQVNPNQPNPNQPNPNQVNPYGGYPQMPNNAPYPQGYYPGQQPGGYPPSGQPQAGNKAQKNPKVKKSKAPNSPKKPKQKKPSNVGWVFLGIFIMLGLIVGGAVLGYNTAIKARMSQYEAQSVQAASQQYQLALSDITNGNFENAKTRLEYVLSVDPNYPGATEKYTEVVISLYPKETPTPFYTTTPAPTSTPDTRGEEEMFNTIAANMAASEWETAISNMDALRDKNLEYRSMEVDGMYYIALRNWGINLINQGYLESGIYKITLAEAFGPIDGNANSQRDAARYYLAGSGFWEIDWAKALEYYSNAYLNAPNMYDRASGYTAQQRYAEASFEYANQLVVSQDYCGAITYYDQGYSIGSNDAYAPTATAAYLECYPPAPTQDLSVVNTVAPVVEETAVTEVPLAFSTETPPVDNIPVILP